MNDELINTLRANYKKKLPDKMKTIKLQWDELQKEWGNEKIESLFKSIHMLNGSSGSYGYPEISEVAKELEIYLKELFQHHQSFSENHIREIQVKLEKINIVINKILLSTQDE